jgi:anaerobic selenocysteine-containing dehydrogenase
MKRVPTVCARDCYDSCAAWVETDEKGDVLALRGDAGHPVTRGFLCPRGIRDHARLHTGRIEGPRLRVGFKPGRSFRPAGWPEALERATAALQNVLKRHGPERLLYLDYAGNVGLLSGVFPRRLWQALGAASTDHTLCSASGHAALALHYGASYGLQPEDLARADLIVFWGCNARVSFPHGWALARQACRRRNARLVVIDPRRSESAAAADLWLRPRPGSDVALAYGIAHLLIRDGCTRPDFLAKHTSGFADFAREAEVWTPERTETETGVPPAQLAALAGLYGREGKRALVLGLGYQKSSRGAEMVRAAGLLPALVGLHRGFFYANSQGYAVDEEMLSGRSLVAPGRAGPVVSQVALGKELARGRFKLVWVSGMNPAVTLPDQGAVREGLCRDDLFVVQHDSHWTATSAYADIILPAATYLEKEDLVLPWSHWYVQKSSAAVPPLYDSRGEAALMAELAGRLKRTEGWLYEDPWQALGRACRGALAGGTFADLLAGKRLRLRCAPRRSYPTPSGKIEFRSARARELGLAELPRHRPRQSGQRELVLLNSSLRRYTHTQFQEIYGPIPAYVLMNPRDARERGLAGEQTVVLANAQGEITVKLRVGDSVPPGVLWSPKELCGLKGEPQNLLTAADPQAVGGGSVFNSTLVTVRPA